MSKELKIRKIPTGMYEVYFEGGGSIPDALKGMFTHTSVAQSAIEAFQAGVRENASKSAQVQKAGA